MTPSVASQSLGKVRLTVDTLDSIRSNIAAYAGGPAIARELIQNADDAKAAWIEFYFSDTELVVGNSSLFSDKDFEAVLKIGSGSKRTDQETTGTWGTGFLSVYQLTDQPVIQSAGRLLQVDPTGHDFDYYPSEVKKHTSLHFRWRKEPTDISRQIEADIWPLERIEKFKQDLLPEIYRALPFLRYIERIEVSDKDGPLCRVVRQKIEEEALPGGVRFERWNFKTTMRGQSRSKTDQWLFYLSCLPQGYEYHQQVIKNPDYAIAIGPRENGLETNLAGTLYNFLPTEILTGFNFHLQGDFFPDANRKSILNGDGSKKSAWNEQLLSSLAQLFASNVMHLRQQIVPSNPSPTSLERFYRLLPIAHDLRYPFLAPIVEAFREKAKTLPLAYTTDKKWTLPPDLRNVLHSKFRPLVEDYLPGIAPTNFLPGLFEFLKTVGSRGLNLSDFINFIRAKVINGTLLTEAHPVVNSREKLNAIFKFFIYSQSLNPEQREPLLEVLTDVPLCLDMQERLWTFESNRHRLYLADEATRTILEGSDVPMVELTFQKTFQELLKEKLDEFGAVEMVKYLSQLGVTADRRIISAVHPTLNRREKLEKLCHYLLSRQVFEYFQPGQLTGLPLLLDENQRVRLLSADLYLADPELRALLGNVEIDFVAPEIENSSSWVRFLEQAEVQRLNPSRLISRLKDFYPAPQPQAQILEPFGQPAFLTALYHYFKHTAHLSQEDMAHLRQLPFVLTQKGNLTALDNPGQPLSLPPASGNLDLQGLSDILQLDYLINPQILDEASRDFFKNQLHTPELDAVQYIGRYLCPNYNKVELNHQQRLELLFFVQRTLPQLRSITTGQQVLELLRQTRLIRCQDDEYRLPTAVYFQAEYLERVFPYGYPIPHQVYLSYKDEPAPESPLLEHSPWQILFEMLGVSDKPEASDLVGAVERSVRKGRPEPNSREYEHVRQVYQFLNEHWEQAYQYQAEGLNPLKNMSWLPAKDELNSWFAPEELYPINLRELVESQVKLLPFSQARREFSNWLGLNIEAKLTDVVEHLLWLSQHNQPPGNQLYEYLNRQRNSPELDKLKQEAVIYDRKQVKYWRPEKVFTGNFYEDFGSYYLYLGEEVGDWTNLFQRIGVRQQPDPLKDYPYLLREISRQAGSRPVSKDDERLIIRAYEKLSLSLPASGVPDWLKALRQEAIVLDQKGQLRTTEAIFFSNRPVLVEKFEVGTLFLAQSTAGGRPFLDLLGVQSLSEVVKRIPLKIEPVAPLLPLKSRLQVLKPQFERIVAHYRRVQGIKVHSDLEWIKQVEIYEARMIQVRYQIEYSTGPILGQILEEEAFFDSEKRKLYLKKNKGQHYFTALARELVFLLDAALEPSVLIPTLKELLKSGLQGEAAECLLDENEIDRLPYRQRDLSEVDQTVKKQAVAQVRNLAEAEAEVGFVPETEPEFAIPKVSRPAQTHFDAVLKLEPATIVDGATEPFSIQLASLEPAQKEVVQTITVPTSGVKLEIESASVNSELISPVIGQELEKQANLERRKEKEASPANKTETDLNPNFIPPFQGEVRPSVPYILTDYERLRQKYGAQAQQTSNQSDWLNWETTFEKKASHQNINWDEPEVAEDAQNQDRTVDEVSFVLSFMMRHHGFLPLNKSAKELLKGQPRQLRCQTEFGQEFPLYIDRQRAVIYNQEALTSFFGAYTLPAGAIVRLRRVHANLFRLYYKADRHLVREVRMVELEDGRLNYIVQPEIEVECETVETVFRAELRLEDGLALFLEAQDKKSVFETIIEVFEFNQATRLTLTEIQQQVFNIRMVTHYAVQGELRRRPCFSEVGPGCWIFEPSLVLMRPDEDSASFSNSSKVEPVPNMLNRASREQPFSNPNLSASANLASSETSSGGALPLAQRAATVNFNPVTTSFTGSKQPDEGDFEFEQVNAAFGSAKLRPETAFSEKAWTVKVEDANDLSEILEQLLQVLVELEKNPVRLTAFLQAFSEPFNRFVSAVNRLYHIQNQAEQSAEKLFGTVLENAQYLLASLRNDSADWQSSESFKTLMYDLFQEVGQVQGQTASRSDLETILAQAGPTIWESQLRPALRQVVEELRQQRKYRAGADLLQLDYRYTNQDVEEQVKWLQAQQDAYDYYSLCQQTNASSQEKIALLMDALTLNPNLTEARRLLDGQVQIFLGEQLEQVLEEVQKGQLITAVRHLETVQILRRQYEPQLYNKNSLANFDPCTAQIFVEANKKLSRQFDLTDLLEMGRLYLALPLPVQSKFCLENITVLIYLARQYRLGQPFEATLAGSQALQIWKQIGFNNGNSVLLLQLHSILAESYAELEMWDDCHIQRREVTKLCSEKERGQAKQAEEEAAKKRTNNELTLMKAHNEYLGQLRQLCQEQRDPFLALGQAFIEKQITREQKYINERG